MNGIPIGKPPVLDGGEVEVLLDELPRDEDVFPAEATLIFECIALNAVWTAAELLRLISTTRTVRLAARASSSMDWTSESICRKSASLDETINVFVRASMLSVSLMLRPC